MTLYGFVNTPRGPGPFPVLIMNHGYLNPAHYQTLTHAGLRWAMGRSISSIPASHTPL